METEKKKIGNPLTIIGVFAGLSEIAMVSALALLNEKAQESFSWLVIGYTVLLILLFFVTLNFNSKVLYAPSDFKDERHYMENMRSGLSINSQEKNEDIPGIEYFENQTFVNRTITIDNKDFLNCQFQNCTLIFNAGAYIGLKGCSFDDVNWSLGPVASRTLGFLSSVYSDLGESGKELIDATFENVKSGVYKS